ncbi:MAG: hypothetical protein GOU98_04920 [Candidatus Altiarchaeota archaeon]|nr:hypothetical protein [Candidatus Altiarchaeota archaeon]
MLNFELLRDAHRKERGNPSIQTLTPDFWKSVAEYFSVKMEKYQELRNNSSRFTDKVLAKFEREMRNAANVVIEFYALRERKIILMSWSEVATDEKTDTRPLTPEEKEFFTRMTGVMRNVRENILDKALAGEITDMSLSKKQETPDKYTVEVLEDVQAFMGTDLNLYGPYSEGEKVELPEKYAKLLVDKGKAKLIEDEVTQ